MFRDALRRKSAPAFTSPGCLLSANSVALGGGGGENAGDGPMFYITLNIEGVDDEEEDVVDTRGKSILHRENI